MEHEIIFATYIIAFSTIGAVILGAWFNSRQVRNVKEQNELSKKHIRFLAMLEVMRFFNERQNAIERNIIYIANRKNLLYKENGDIHEEFSHGIETHRLQMYAASTLGTMDQMGKLVKDGYVDEEEFLEMYMDPVIRIGKVLRRFILFQREERKTEHFMNNFEKIFNDARIFWEKKFPGQPEPEPF